MKKVVKFLVAVVVVASLSTTFVSCDVPEVDPNAEKSWDPTPERALRGQYWRISMFEDFKIKSIVDSKGNDLLKTTKQSEKDVTYDFNNKILTIKDKGIVISKTPFTIVLNPNKYKNFILDSFEIITENKTYKNVRFMILDENEQSKTIEYLNANTRKITFTVTENNEDITYVIISDIYSPEEFTF